MVPGEGGPAGHPGCQYGRTVATAAPPRPLACVIPGFCNGVRRSEAPSRLAQSGQFYGVVDLKDAWTPVAPPRPGAMVGGPADGDLWLLQVTVAVPGGSKIGTKRRGAKRRQALWPEPSPIRPRPELTPIDPPGPC